jgi:hypothetical protein
MYPNGETMEKRIHPVPFRHKILDGHFDADLVRSAADSFGAVREWVVEYDTPLEKKKACNHSLPTPAAVLMGQILQLPIGEWFGVPEAEPDTTLWGAGMHLMEPGGFLDLHLDSDHVHDKLRRFNAVLFLNHWEKSWGGFFQMFDHERSFCSQIAPAFNRLVVFECSDISYHRVSKVTGPDDRKTLTAFWYTSAFRRPRAKFVPMKHEEPDAIKDKLRAERAV